MKNVRRLTRTLTQLRTVNGGGVRWWGRRGGVKSADENYTYIINIMKLIETSKQLNTRFYFIFSVL